MARGLVWRRGTAVRGTVMAVVLVAATFGAAVAARQPPSARDSPAVEVSNDGCGRGWSPGSAGLQALHLYNAGGLAAHVSVLVPATGAVVGEIEALGPGATRVLRVDVGPGTYALRCHLEGDDPVTGPRVRVRGHGAVGPAVVPVTYNDLYGPVRAYQRIVGGRLGPLVTATDRLRDAVRDGDRDAARAAWLPAHLDYERLGGAYGAFGDLGERIDGVPAPGAADSPDFTGFHRVERGLWHGTPMSDLRGPADHLAGDVRALRDQWPDQRVDPLDLGLRAHEIMEDTERIQLTGRADQGSGTELATAAANLDGTRDVLRVLRPLLRTRYPGLRDLDAWLDRADRVLAAHHHDGHWTALDDLSRIDRQRVNGTIAGLLERLAPVAEICAPRRVS